VGSEGTLALTTEVVLRLIPLPPAVETALAVFGGDAGEDQALAAVQGLFAAGLLPRACEFLDRSAMQALGARAPFPLPADASAALIVEVDGTPEGCAAELEVAQRAFEQAGARDVILARNDSERRRVWDTRRLVSP